MNRLHPICIALLAPRHRTTLEFLLYAVLTAVMLHATWLTWPDAFIDFSRELYLPWRVSCGDVLYRDLAYYFGPVSVYTNAALFALLGRPSIHALFALNFAFWVATLFAFRAILRRIASPLAATIAVSSFILLFSFSRYNIVGNYNFLAPYSHELVRGFLFSLLVLLSLDSALRRLPVTPPSPHLFLSFLISGFLYALVLFTKPELALATSAAITLLFALHSWQSHVHPFRSLFLFALAAFVTVALVVAPFAVAFHSIPHAIHDAFLKLYLDCFNSDLSSLSFFQIILGTDQSLPNALRFLCGVLLAILPFLLAHLVLPRLPSRHLQSCATLLLSAIAAAIGWYAWPHLNAALPFAPLAFLALLPWKRREVAQPPEPATSSFPLSAAFALFAFLLVFKMFLNASVTFYGFVLALPAFCCSILLVFRTPHSRHRVAIAASLLSAFLAGGLYCNAATLHHHTIRAPVFDGSFLTAGFQAQAFNHVLAWLRDNTPPSTTLAVLPEGAILNVFARRPNPTPYISLPITDIPRYDAGALVSAYSNAPPDTLVLVSKLGEPRFGIDYAQDLMAFLDPLYSPVLTIPLSTTSGTIPYLVIARKSDPVGVLPDADRKF